MKKTIWIGAGLSLLILAALFSNVLDALQDPPASASVRDQLIGAWRLVSNVEPDANGKMQNVEYEGTIVYTRDGHMSVQIMPRSPSAALESTGPVKYAGCGYEAYFGRFDIDERAQTVTHHVEGALVRTLIGTDLTRVYKLSGKQLILKSSRPDEHWTITWEHY